MRTSLSSHALSVGLAGALAAAAIAPSTAAPVLSNTAAVKSAASDHVTDVRWRGGGAVAAGIGAGLLFGALAAATQPRYYGPYYGSPYYGSAYYDPYYYRPAYGAYYGYGGGYYATPAYGYYDTPYYAMYSYGYPYPGQQRYFQGRVDTNTVGNW